MIAVAEQGEVISVKKFSVHKIILLLEDLARRMYCYMCTIAGLNVESGLSFSQRQHNPFVVE